MLAIQSRSFPTKSLTSQSMSIMSDDEMPWAADDATSRTSDTSGNLLSCAPLDHKHASALHIRAKRERSQPLNKDGFYEEDSLVRKSIKRASEKESQFGKGSLRSEMIREFWLPAISSLKRSCQDQNPKRFGTETHLSNIK